MLNNEYWDSMRIENCNNVVLSNIATNNISGIVDDIAAQSNIDLSATKFGKSAEDWIKEFIIDEYTPALLRAMKNSFNNAQILDILKCELLKHDTKEVENPRVENNDNMLL